MLEARPIWILVLTLNVCIFIWLIAIEEPVVLNVTTTSININNNYNDIHTMNAYNNNNNNNNDKNANTNIHLNYHHMPLHLIDEKFKRNNITNRFRKHGNLRVISQSQKLLISTTLPQNDYKQLIDLLDYRDLMIQPPCKFHIKGVILIHSAPKNHEKRQIIRDTWGKLIHANQNSADDDGNALRLLFLLGAVHNLHLQEMLQFENEIYGDLIQGSFIDDYRNMTYKHVMAFKWFLYNCPNAQILIKVDDDVYVNTFQLIDYIKLSTKQSAKTDRLPLKMNGAIVSHTMASVTTTQKETTIIKQSLASSNNNSNNVNMNVSLSLSLSLSSQSASISTSQQMNNINEQFNAKLKLFHQPQNLLFCKPTVNSLVKRSHRSKWRVSYREYNQRYYPTYCPGYAIIYSTDVVLRLYMSAQKAKYFWIDDVHITGILAQKTNITITSSSHYVLSMERFEQLLTHDIDLDQQEFLFAWHSITAKQIYRLWLMQMLKYNMTLNMAIGQLEHHLKSDFKHNNTNVSLYMNTNTIISSLFS